MSQLWIQGLCHEIAAVQSTPKILFCPIEGETWNAWSTGPNDNNLTGECSSFPFSLINLSSFMNPNYLVIKTFFSPSFSFFLHLRIFLFGCLQKLIVVMLLLLCLPCSPPLFHCCLLLLLQSVCIIDWEVFRGKTFSYNDNLTYD